MSAYITELTDGSFQLNIPSHGKILTEPLSQLFQTRGEGEAWLHSEEGEALVQSIVEAKLSNGVDVHH